MWATRSSGITQRSINRFYSSGQVMNRWQIVKYGNISDALVLNRVARIPCVDRATDLLIKVHATSVNPLDTLMVEGYGSTVFPVLKTLKNISSCNTTQRSHLPLTVGRDFSGTVVSRGPKVSRLQVGDEVWGVVDYSMPGCHAEYVVASETMVDHKPTAWNHEECASLPFAAMTAWSILSSAKLTDSTSAGKRVLLNGGAGGVASVLIQVLKAWGAEVTVISSPAATTNVNNLGADFTVDYKSADWPSNLASVARSDGFDVAIDCCGDKSLGSYVHSGGSSVELMSKLDALDDKGLILGTISTLGCTVKQSLELKRNGVTYSPALMQPSLVCLQAMDHLIRKEKIRSFVEITFPFLEAPKAYEYVRRGKAKGKTVMKLVN